MPKVTEAYLEARRRQILEAAIACFARKGFHQTTMEDIGKEAGLSPGVAYRYFDNKAAIIEASEKESLRRFANHVQEVKSQQDILAVLISLTSDIFENIDQSEAVNRRKVRQEIMVEALRNPNIGESSLKATADARDLLAELVRNGQENGQINPDLDAHMIARVIMALGDGIISQWLLEPDIDVWKFRDVMVAMLNGTFRLCQKNVSE